MAYPRLLLGLLPLLAGSLDAAIDRQALVTRHNLVRTSADPLVFQPGGAHGMPHAPSAEPMFSPLQVGNGRFAFSLDVTGLQTFIPAQTMAHWGWHTEPLPEGLSPEDFRWIEFPTAAGRKVPYAFVALSPQDAHADLEVPMSEQQRKLAFWIRANPHLLNLARIKMELLKSNGAPAELSDLRDVRQELDLWSGIITSEFSLEGQTVRVRTRAHPERDAVAVRIESSLLETEQLHVSWSFPYGDTRKQTVDVGNFEAPERHRTQLQPRGAARAHLLRTLDEDRYLVDVSWSDGARLLEEGPHAFALRPTKGRNVLWFVAEFVPQVDQPPALVGVAEANASRPPLNDEVVEAASREYWPRYWKSGAALDLSGTDDPRAREIERRVVLSQYLMAVQEAGPLPPQEAGLVNLGWHGKFHLEMYPWHVAHYALWDRWELLDRSRGYYQRMLPLARALAERQGYAGARWPKMVGPDGGQSPGNVNPFLLWQQPHPMLLAELEWRARPTRDTLQQWSEVITATADFMADLPVEREGSRYLHLGPPLKTVSENTPAATTWDPSFDLSYWRFGLQVAQRWSERLGQKPADKWGEVLQRLAPLPEKDGRYLLSATQPDTYEAWHWEHPAVAGIYGLLPGDGADVETMRRSLEGMMKHWSFDRVWGWDFPMLAMCAARLGQPELAVDLLVHKSPNFQFADSGLATGGPWPYFPSNGSLLYAVGLMAAGWDGGAEDKPAPGFPVEWNVKAEGFRRAP